MKIKMPAKPMNNMSMGEKKNTIYPIISKIVEKAYSCLRLYFFENKGKHDNAVSWDTPKIPAKTEYIFSSLKAYLKKYTPKPVVVQYPIMNKAMEMAVKRSWSFLLPFPWLCFYIKYGSLLHQKL